VRLAGMASAYLASTLAQAGDLRGAELLARPTVDSLKSHPPTRCLALGIFARVRLSQGDAEEALAATAAATALLDALGGVEEGESVVRLAHARALFALGHADEARAAIVIARDRVLARAGRIDDAALRSSFLERIREHVETFELAASQSFP
jgi:hypothetical protein